jgi:prolyl 4-hydroxylase
LEAPEEGGATIFPSINLRIRPIKNAAVFWYNLFDDETGNSLSLHSGCPVLLGSKWLANMWISARGQEFNKPCGLKFSL